MSQVEIQRRDEGCGFEECKKQTNKQLRLKSNLPSRKPPPIGVMKPHLKYLSITSAKFGCV